MFSPGKEATQLWSLACSSSWPGSLDSGPTWLWSTVSSPIQLWDTAGGPTWSESLASDLAQQQSMDSSLPDYKAQPVALPEHRVQPEALYIWLRCHLTWSNYRVQLTASPNCRDQPVTPILPGNTTYNHVQPQVTQSPASGATWL